MRAQSWGLGTTKKVTLLATVIDLYLPMVLARLTMIKSPRTARKYSLGATTIITADKTVTASNEREAHLILMT